MDTCWNIETKQINKYNGQYVMATLSSLGGKATKNELVTRILSTTSEPHEAVDEELSRILTNGVDYGFIRKNGSEYLLPAHRNTFEIDSDVGKSRTVKEEPEDSDNDLEVDDEADYLKELEDMMKLTCRSFRSKLLENVIDVAVAEDKETDNLTQDFINHVLHLSTIPEDHVDACMKIKLTEFYIATHQLLHRYEVRDKILRYTVVSVDTWVMESNMCKFEQTKQQAIKRFINDVVELESGDCEILRTIYINHLLNKVIDGLKEGTQFACELFMQLDLEDKNENVSGALRNLVQKAFVYGKSGKCPIEAYFKFLSDRKARTTTCRPVGARGRKRKGRK